MARTTRKILTALAFAAVVLALTAPILWRDPSPTLPNPNGYDDFVKAGRMVTTLDGHDDLGDYPELSLESLRAFAATNAEALRIARGALEQQCRVPVQSSADWFRAHLGEMMTFKDLTRVFLVAGRLAQLEGQTNDAVDIYLDLLRFAHESTRGGTITDYATARTQEALGLDCLKSLEPALNAVQCRRVAKVLEELDALQESWNDYFRHDVHYALRAETTSLLSLDSWRVRQRFKTRFYQAQLRRRQTMLAFAVRAYELDTGTKPGGLTDLVPAYLKAFPQDPLTRTNLVLAP